MEKRCWFQDELGNWVGWDAESSSYSRKLEKDGWEVANGEDQEVYSVIFSASGVTPEANLVYPPIGPYRSGIIEAFNPNSADDRYKAAMMGLNDKNCNICLRITQGNKTRDYLMKVMIKPDDNPFSRKHHYVAALNLPAANGEVTKVELLHTPEVMSKGITDGFKLLNAWEK